MKKRSERRKHCAPAAVHHRHTESAMAVVRHSQIPPPPQTPFPEAQDRRNLISWRGSLPATTDPVWWRSMHVISSYRGNRHLPPARPPATNTQTHRQDRLQYTAPLSLARSVIKFICKHKNNTATITTCDELMHKITTMSTVLAGLKGR